MSIKKATKLIKNAGGIDKFTNYIDFKFGKLIIPEINALINQEAGRVKSSQPFSESDVEDHQSNLNV